MEFCWRQYWRLCMNFDLLEKSFCCSVFNYAYFELWRLKLIWSNLQILSCIKVYFCAWKFQFTEYYHQLIVKGMSDFQKMDNFDFRYYKICQFGMAKKSVIVENTGFLNPFLNAISPRLVSYVTCANFSSKTVKISSFSSTKRRKFRQNNENVSWKTYPSLKW